MGFDTDKSSASWRKIVRILLVLAGAIAVCAGAWLAVFTGNPSNWRKTKPGSFLRRALATRIALQEPLKGSTKAAVTARLGSPDDIDAGFSEEKAASGNEWCYLIGENFPLPIDNAFLVITFGKNERVRDMRVLRD